MRHKDVMIKCTWYDRPDRNKANQEDVFAGFAKAYDDCIKYLRYEVACI